MNPEDRQAAERHQSSARRQFETAFLRAPAGMAMLDLDGRWLRVNPALSTITGYPVEELRGLTFADITHPDDLEADLAMTARMLAGEIDSYQLEKRYLRRDGGVAWVLLAASIVRGDDGEPLHFIAHIQEISDRKRMEEELRDAALGFQLAGDMLCTATFDGYLVGINQSWTDALGWSADELRSRRFIEFVHPDDRAPTLEVTRTFEDGGESRFFRNRWGRKDGSWCWLSWSAVGIVEEQRVYCVARDITERVEIEQALQLQGEITENMAKGVALVTMSEQPTIVYANPNFERDLGYEPGELAGRAAIPLLEPPDLSPQERESRDRAAEALGTEGQASYEARRIRRDGEEVWCRLTISTFDHPQFGPVWVTVQQEITEARRAREAKEAAERSKDEFVGSVSHELRTPLSSILGYTALLLAEGDRLGAENREFVAIIERNAKRQLRLVEDLLSLPQAQAGEWQLQVREMDLAEVTRNAIEELRPAAEEKELGLEIEADEALPVAGDADRLTQVVLNLASNAIKYSRRGGRIAVRVQVKGERAVLRVADSGPGIPEEAREHVFEPLYRGREARRRVSGAGLGLAIAKSVVQAHRGEIAIAEAGPGGTTIEVSLPLRRRPAAQPLSASN